MQERMQWKSEKGKIQWSKVSSFLGTRFFTLVKITMVRVVRQVKKVLVKIKIHGEWEARRSLI